MFINKNFNKILNLQQYALSNMQEQIELIIYSVVALFIPFFLAHPQFLVGSVVNGMLVLAALNIKGLKLIPIIILPSVGVTMAGLLFGTLTPFLFYMMIFIWIGNAILVLGMKQLHLHKKINSWLSLGIGAIVKTIFLFASAFVLVSLNIIPAMFLTVMGLFQLYTAIIGGAGALLVQTLKQKIA